MNKKIVGAILGIALLGGCYFQSKNDLTIPEGQIKTISFLDLDNNGENLIYTAGEESYIDKGGEKIPIKFRIFSNFKAKDKEYYIAGSNGKVGIINRELKEVIAFNYDSLEKINDEFIRGERDGEFYLIDIEKYSMLGPYKNLYGVSNGEIIVATDTNGTSYLDEKGNKIQGLDEKNILFFRGAVAVTEKNGLFGMYDVENKKYVEENNQEIYFADNNLLIKRDGKYYFNDKELDIKRVYPTMSDVVIYDLGEGFGLFDLKDGSFSKEPYDEVAPNYDRYVIVGKGGKYGIIDKYTEKGSNYEFDYINKLGRNSFIAGTDEVGLFALVVDDKKITEEKYENFIEISENYYIGMAENKYTLLDKTGKEIVTCKKDDLLYYNKEVVIVRDRMEQRFYILESEE